jgi:opacity protein-like surface antigen
VKKNLLILLLFVATVSHAQRLSVEAFAGLANYQGDLQENRYTLAQSRAAISLGLGYALTDKFSIRGLATLGSIQADDKYNTKSLLQGRNLNFKSKIYDASLVAVYDFFSLDTKRFTPYVFAGISAFHFNPYTNDSSGKKVFLRTLSTEGEGLPQYPDRKLYKLNQISIPLGGGIKFVVNDNVTVGWEFQFHKTFTDYLDDVSRTYVDYNTLLAARGQTAVDLAYRGDELKNGNPSYPSDGTIRGSSKYKDWYYFSGITASFRIITKKDGQVRARRGGGSGIACPPRVY